MNFSTASQTPTFHASKELTESVSSPSSRSLVQFHGDSTEVDFSANEQKLILSIAWWGGKIGAAYFNTQSQELSVIPDIVENTGDTTVLRGLFFQLQPHTLIIKENQDENQMAVIYQLIGLTGQEVELHEGPEQVHLQQTCYGSSSNFQMKSLTHLYAVPSSFYNADGALRRLRALRLGTAPHNMSNTERWIHLKSVFPFDYPALLQATGALLKMLEQWRRGQDVDRLIELAADDIRLSIFSISTCRFDDCLWMDQSTFLSLKIFSEESHPSSFKKGQSQSAKEGLSLFGIASKCHSTPGSLCLKNIFLRPIRNIETLNDRYKVIQFCKEASNIEVVRTFKCFLKNISDVKVPLLNISTMRCTLNDWKKLQITAKNLIALADKCKFLPQNIRLFCNLSDIERSNKWYFVVDTINRLINFQESKRIGRCVVNSGVDEDLDKLKRDHSNMDQIYTEAVNLEMENLPPFIEQGFIEFFPHVGHCLCLRSWLADQHLTAELLTIAGLELKFFTKENVYYKSRRCYELDEMYGDFTAAVVAHEMSVMLSGSKVVLQHYDALVKGIELAGYLDALLSLSALSSEFEMVQPQLIENEEGHIQIEKGRHILMQLVAERFNPNSTYLGGKTDAKRTNVISGPNSSGKSVYLMQTALIVYMAQIGCFVPAKSVSLTPMKHIFVVSHFPETVVTSLSHFGVELSLMSIASREAASHSLVIVDEFGIGSTYVDGSALLISCIEHWVKQQNGPLLLVATHMHDAVDYLSRSSIAPRIQFSSMGYFFDEEQLVFQYRLVEEVCVSSFPLSVAYAAGLPDFVINRAQEIFKAENLTPNKLLWNDAKCTFVRKIAEHFFAIDPGNIDDLKHYIRRSTLSS